MKYYTNNIISYSNGIFCPQTPRLFWSERSHRREAGETEAAGLDVSLQFRAGRVGDRSAGAAGPRGQNIPSRVQRHTQRGQNISKYLNYLNSFEFQMAKPLLWETVRLDERFSFVNSSKLVHVVVDDQIEENWKLFEW